MNPNELMDESDTVNDENETSFKVLLEPNADFIRTDNSISSTKSRDLDFCFKIALKEAVKEEKLVKQIFYTMLSAYTNNPINLAINAPSGEGKTHVLTMVGNLFPKTDVMYIAGMSSKAIFHKNGYIAVRDEDGEYVKVEDELQQLKEILPLKKLELIKIKGTNSKIPDTVAELEKEIEKYNQRIKEIEKNAVKVIDLSYKILVFLDTPSSEIFEALMSLLSHDKYEVEYQFVDTSSKTGLKTCTNVLMGWPSVIFAQAIDYSRNPRYQEIQRRFIITNPKMDAEKYECAFESIIEKNCLPDFVYQQKVVSDEEKDTAKEIILNIRDDLLFISSKTKPGKNNICVPFVNLLKNLIPKSQTAQDMTFANRVLHLVQLLTKIHFKQRPYLEINPIFGSDTIRIPMALYSDLSESLSLLNNHVGGIRPYVFDWYQNIFLRLYDSKSIPNSKFKNGEVVAEEKIAVTTQELIVKTSEIMKKHYTSKNLLTEFLYPLLNLGYVDSIRSLIDGRAYIYFPVLHTTNEKSINLFQLDKKNNLFQNNHNYNENLTSNIIKTHIISNISEVERYYSENKHTVALRFADEDTISLKEEEQDDDKNVEEIFEKYYSEFFEDNIENNNKVQDNGETCHNSNTSSPEEYSKKITNDDILQDHPTNSIGNDNLAREQSINLFLQEKKNNIIYSCYRCEFETNIQTEYERHYVLDHPSKPAYPSLADLLKDGLKPQGKHWE